MNILFIIKKFPHFGGIAMVTQMLANRFIEDGHHVVVATLMRNPDWSSEEQIPNGVVIKELEPPTWNLSNVSRIRSIIDEYNIDVIINQWALRPEVTYICNKARKGKKCKLICELHGAPNTTKMLIAQKEKLDKSRNIISKIVNTVKLKAINVITKFSIKYVYNICDYYILLSKGFVPILVDYAHLKHSDKLRVIGNAIGFSSEGFNYSFDKKKKQILYVGRMDPYNKRVNRIVEAWEQLFLDYPDWTLELVGEGPQLDYLKDYVSSNNIKRVNFHGFQKEPPRNFYEDASILMLTSDLEGFGLVIVEGMQFGVVPVIYGSYVAVYDIIDNNKDGFITPMPYSRDQTVKCLKALMDNDSQRNNMAKAAIEKSKQYTMDSMASQWYKLFS